MATNNPQTTPQQQIARAAESATKTAERVEGEAERMTSMALDKVRQAREEAQSGIEQQRDQLAQRIRRVSDVLRANGTTLGYEDPLTQQLFEKAGDSVDRVASYISTVTPRDLADDLQSVARRSPGLFFGGSFLVGLALGRFAKSTGASLGGSYGDDIEQPPAPRRTHKQHVTPHPRSAQASSGALPRGVGSSVPGTVGVGSAHSPAPNAPPSYGGASAIPAGRAAPEETPRNVSARSHAVEPGEGSKS